jgi:hypothetical protein
MAMALPIPPNVTFDIYHQPNAPPAAPNVAGVKGHLVERFGNIKPPGSATHPFNTYTHVLHVAVNTDLRDDATAPDAVYVPDKNGTKFVVVWVARQGRGTALDMKVAYLARSNPAWPTTDL